MYLLTQQIGHDYDLQQKGQEKTKQQTVAHDKENFIIYTKTSSIVH